MNSAELDGRLRIVGLGEVEIALLGCYRPPFMLPLLTRDLTRMIHRD